MQLLLLRHAEAEDHAASDAARRVTPLGLEQARTVGRFCARTGVEPELVLFSPFVRTEQTARAFAEAWPPGGRTIQAAPFVASGMQPETALRELRAYERFSCLMLIGHQPDLSLLAASLLGWHDADGLAVGKATLLGLVIHSFSSRGGRLEYHVPVKLMR